MDLIMESMFVTHLSRLKLLRGFIMIAPNQVPFAASSLFVSVLSSPTLSQNRSKFGSRIEGTIACTTRLLFLVVNSFMEKYLIGGSCYLKTNSSVHYFLGVFWFVLMMMLVDFVCY